MIRALLILGAALLAAGAGLAQDTSQTGSGGTAGSISDIQGEFDKQWNGTPGQLIKGAIGFAGLALVIGATNDALSFDGSVTPDGASVNAGGSGAGTNSTGTSTSTTTTSSTTSTN